MNYFLQGFGAFWGVLAGTVITILTTIYLSRREETQKLKNLKFELELNITKINSWLEEMRRYRDAVNGDSLQNYFGYFDLSRFVSVTVTAMFNSGALYKHFTHEDIGKLQSILSELSLGFEKILNDEISNNRNVASGVVTLPSKDGAIPWQIRKPVIVGKVNFWESKFKAHKKTLEEIVTKIKL